MMGVQSDGLVAIRNAYVFGSARAYVHRSHSGRYGLVNSEEVYQNMKRFLLGGLRVEVGMHGLHFREERIWQAEVRLAIRGLSVLVHEQTSEHYCPVDLNAEALHIPTPMSPVPLVTVFLMANDQHVCRYALDLKVTSLKETGGIFGFGEHLEQIGDWQDALIVDVVLDDDDVATSITWEWNSALRQRPGQPDVLGHTLEWKPNEPLPHIPLPSVGQFLLGEDASLALGVTKWD